ncbi:cyclin-like protein [Zalaria obscura]|uniref:Cyclin-like protein n=1 Tax=Zalaria obscura TaxID=2024903 RepID=A0ACC3S2V6_9PEZI
MPSFYPRPTGSQLPLTPPDFMPASYDHSCRGMQYPQDQYMAQQAIGSRQDNGYDYSRGYAPSATTSNQQSLYHPGNYSTQHSLPPISSYYEPQGAPILPPLRMQDHAYAEDEYRRQQLQQEQLTQAARQQTQQQQAPKEEKATGGVSAKLDYDMDRMTDFVSEMAQGMYALHTSKICLADIDIIRSIHQGPLPHQGPFRKWVAQVLSATRLPSATILLSLHYLTVRMKDHPRSVGSSENQIYRLLAVALILGSKFLDDNTFINRSWSDVSGIKVSELNVLEIEWLSLIRYDLHCDPSDPAGLSQWITAWKNYDTRAVSKARASRLSPLNTSIHRQTSMRSSHSPYQQQYAKGSHGEFTPVSGRSGSGYSTPYSTADPWNRSDHANMDSYYNNHYRYPTFDELDHSTRLTPHEQARRSAFGYNALPPLQSYTPAPYANHWASSPWNSVHPHGCVCMTCSGQFTYNMAPGYGAQTVAG